MRGNGVSFSVAGGLGLGSGAPLGPQISGNYYGAPMMATPVTASLSVPFGETWASLIYVHRQCQFSHIAVQTDATVTTCDLALFSLDLTAFGVGTEIDRVTGIALTGSVLNEVALTETKDLAPGWYVLAIGPQASGSVTVDRDQITGTALSDFGHSSAYLGNGTTFKFSTAPASVVAGTAFAALAAQEYAMQIYLKAV